MTDGLLTDPPPPRPGPGPACGIARSLDRLGQLDRAKLVDWLEGDTYDNKQIAAALRAIGLDVSHQIVGHHRRGDCRCHR